MDRILKDRTNSYWQTLQESYSQYDRDLIDTKFITPPSPGKHYSLDSEDNFRFGCRNVSHQQQFFSELLTRTIPIYELLFKNTMCLMSNVEVLHILENGRHEDKFLLYNSFQNK